MLLKTRILLVWVMLVVLLLVAGGLALRRMMAGGFSTREKPSRIEELIARRLRHLAVPEAARAMKNPVPLDEKALSEARDHFADHCALCHANDGRGETQIGKNLYPPAPDMTLPRTQSLSDGEIFSIIKNGVRLTGMPAWGENTPEDDMASWKLVHFIRHLPQISERELIEMEALNPRSPEEFREEEQQKQFLEGANPSETHHTHHH